MGIPLSGSLPANSGFYDRSWSNRHLPTYIYTYGIIAHAHTCYATDVGNFIANTHANFGAYSYRSIGDARTYAATQPYISASNQHSHSGTNGLPSVISL